MFWYATPLNKILIADRSLPFLMALSLLLKRLGFDVLPAENGMEVLRSAELSVPHLIILGVDIAGMDGITVLRHLKQDKKKSHIPVIMLSTFIVKICHSARLDSP
jgi:CheY-like chemotaxis protein